MAGINVRIGYGGHRLLQRAPYLESELLLHPHVHCVAPAGGLSPDRTHWIAARSGFFLPLHVLSRVFRGKFVARLRELHAAGKLGFHGDLMSLAAPAAFASLLRGLFRSDWVVYAKRPFGVAEHALLFRLLHASGAKFVP